MKQTIPSVSVFGVPVCKWGMQDTVVYLTKAIEAGIPHHVITVNPIMVMAALENPAHMAMMQSAELIVPDGTGVVWASERAGNPVMERVPGYELLHELMKVGDEHGWKVYLLGSGSEVVQETARRLASRYPGVQIVGYHDGYFKAEKDQEVIDKVVKAAPDLLFVARGADTQDPWIEKYKDQLGIPLMMGVGGSFDVISGRTKRAPVVFQKLRLEWLYRVLREPSRLPRMLALPKFVVKVLREGEKSTKTNY